MLEVLTGINEEVSQEEFLNTMESSGALSASTINTDDMSEESAQGTMNVDQIYSSERRYLSSEKEIQKVSNSLIISAENNAIDIDLETNSEREKVH